MTESYEGWKAVTERLDEVEAKALATYLQSTGIPARLEATSENDTTSVNVAVPSWLEQEARYAIEHRAADSDRHKPGRPGNARTSEPEFDLFSRISRAMMVVAAVAFSPFAVFLALIFALGNRMRDK